jgi:saccharopine dehydrogenase (NAD+, L-lysine-forming)
MKVVVFGGAGVIGSYAVNYLAKMEIFSEIMIADMNELKAKEIIKTSNKITFQKTDVTDERNLKSVLKDAKVAINCAGPFYKFAPKILEATISTGVHYIDICDDYDATQILLDNYDKKAIDAGISCVIGLGASPGLTNIIAAYAASQISKVENITIYVTRSIDGEAGGAIPYHMLHCWLGKIPIFRNGKLQWAGGLVDGEEYVTFPEPFGQSAVYYFGHPETVTLPRYIKGVKNVCCKGSFFPTEFRKILLQIESMGLISEKQITVQGQKIKPIDFAASHLETLRKQTIEKSKNFPSGGSVIVDVSGEDDGQPRGIRYAGTSHMQQGTATPVVVGAKMIAEGIIKKPGVNAPEGVVEPEDFVAHFLQHEGFGDVYITFTQKMGPNMI